MVALEFDDPVKSRQDDSFVCRGDRPDAHFRASARSPLQCKARKNCKGRAILLRAGQMDFLRNHQLMFFMDRKEPTA